MPVDRPTFSESWYRVAWLCPRLRSTVQIHRQYFRGHIWHVLQDPASNQFFRLNEAAHRFVVMLDGRRNVADIWEVCNDQLADTAPTQGEVIQLLGQLYTANLLQAELPPDAEGLFKRYRNRIKREVQGYLANLLFVRIPLLDPDHFLDRWVGIFGRAFSWYGLVVWLGVVITGLYFLVSRAGELGKQAGNILDPGNIPYLYLSFILVKVCHEFGHAFACKKFGKTGGSGGEVHVMGIMFLIFMPMPYVDASSAWAFRSKWRRIVVGAGGMFVELAIAAVAAIIWARTGEGRPLHIIAYNTMFIASVSTLLFNANPLLRYDGYYILSDILEIPNLAPRSRQYIYYLTKHYVWGVRKPYNPANNAGEKLWLPLYGVASTIYRVFICSAILLFVAGKFFILGTTLSLAAVVTWVFVPLGKFVRYLATSGELMRTRPRAVLSTVITLAAVFAAIGLIPVADRGRVEGVVEPTQLSVIYMDTDGFVTDFIPSGQKVTPEGVPLLIAHSHELLAFKEQLEAERTGLQARQRLAKTQEVSAFQIITRQIAAKTEQIDKVVKDIAALTVKAPFEGTWIAPDIERTKGVFLRRGDRVGLVASLDSLFIRATAGQEVADRLGQVPSKVEIRAKGRPDIALEGTIETILPAGSQRLPSAALGFAAGGSMATSPEDQSGTRTAERFFELHIVLDSTSNVPLISGQRVIVRFESPPKPLMLQWWRTLLQVLQRRFSI